MSQLVHNLRNKGPLDEREGKYILGRANSRQLRRGEYLLMSGHKCNSIYYVEEGILRSYVIGNTEQERIVMFGFKDWWITDIESFTQRSLASVSIQAITTCTVWELSKPDIDWLLKRSHQFETIFRKMMQYSYMREQRRALEMISLDTRDRYRNLVSRYPDIEQRITQKHIAQYLGVTPEFLSAMKRRVKL